MIRLGIGDVTEPLAPAIIEAMHAAVDEMGTPDGATSWQFFDRLLSEVQVVGTPGAGVGPAGEGYFRLSAFIARANIEESLTRIRGAFRGR